MIVKDFYWLFCNLAYKSQKSNFKIRKMTKTKKDAPEHVYIYIFFILETKHFILS